MRLVFCRAALLLWVLGSACTTYDFEPAEPLAVSQSTTYRSIAVYGLKPNLMLVVDRSGSMNDPIDAALPECPSGASCPTRLSELRTAMGDVLGQYGQTTRLGLTLFPEAAQNACGVGKVALDIGASADEVNSIIQSLAAGGGTPTAATLRIAGALPSLKDPRREDFILLLTDGMPNCNPQNPTDPAACVCTSCGCVQNTCSTLQCLDEDDTLQAIRALAQDGIRTIVVGFGADTASGPAVSVLNAMAEAGGMARRCALDPDCGAAEQCGQDGLCSRRFYQAANAAELGQDLGVIGCGLGVASACTVWIDDGPSDARFISVVVDSVSVPAGPATWTYSDGKVVFAEGGAQCTLIRAATVENPARVEVRVVEPL